MMKFSMNERNPEYAKDPGVVRFNGKYLMYYSAPPYPEGDPRREKGWAIAVAESADLVNWKYVCELPQFSHLEAKGFCAPAARVYNGKVHLFYQTYGSMKNDAICLAVSSDGIHFTPEATNPIYHPAESAWCCGRAIDADVIEYKGKFYLYAATRDPELKIQKLTVAVSDGDFSANGWSSPYDGSILYPELPWEQECIEAPATCIHNDKIYMFYAGAYNNRPQQVGCAVSSDGIHFERISNEPVLPCGKPGEWNSSESGHPYAFTDDDGRQYLFFQGNNDKGKTWYLSCKEIIWQGDMPTFKDLD